MADITVKFFSGSLLRTVSFGIYIPGDQRGENRRKSSELKTLFLLHGYTESPYNRIPKYLCDKYGFAVVTPDGENSFWLDSPATGRKYGEYVGRELTEYLRRTFGLARSADDTYIMGFSMGGFGALHTALAYPENFGKTAAVSSALIVHEVAGMKPGSDNGVANYEYYRGCFGEPSEVLTSEANPETLVKKLLKSGKMPEIYMACGTEDFLLENNRAFHAFLLENGVKHEYHESAGTHDGKFFDEYAVKFVEKMFCDRIL